MKAPDTNAIMKSAFMTLFKIHQHVLKFVVQVINWFPGRCSQKLKTETFFMNPYMQPSFINFPEIYTLMISHIGFLWELHLTRVKSCSDISFRRHERLFGCWRFQNSTYAQFHAFETVQKFLIQKRVLKCFVWILIVFVFWRGCTKLKIL